MTITLPMCSIDFMDTTLSPEEEAIANRITELKSIFKGVKVQVGSGFSDILREKIWNTPEAFLGRTIEVRYQEETPDGSLRFPTFVCFRNDRD